jgi:hypothetical protein
METNKVVKMATGNGLPGNKQMDVIILLNRIAVGILLCCLILLLLKLL